MAILSVVLIRYGVLASMATFFVVQLLILTTPLTLHLTAWFALPTLTSLLAVITLAAWSFRVSLAGRPLFRFGLPQD